MYKLYIFIRFIQNHEISCHFMTFYGTIKITYFYKYLRFLKNLIPSLLYILYLGYAVFTTLQYCKNTSVFTQATAVLTT